MHPTFLTASLLTTALTATLSPAAVLFHPTSSPPTLNPFSPHTYHTPDAFHPADLTPSLFMIDPTPHEEIIPFPTTHTPFATDTSPPSSRDDAGLYAPSFAAPAVAPFVAHLPIPEPATLSLLPLGALLTQRRRPQN